MIVGWYRHATVYRQSQPRPDRRLINGETVEFSVEADFDAARLLGVPARHFLIPTEKDGTGRFIVERRAINHAVEFFESEGGGGYEVLRVEREAKGWDLEAVRPGETLYVEVKGCSGNDVVAELTPNELSKMRDRRLKGDYVIFIATGCYGRDAAQEVVPLAHIFRHHRRDGADNWEADDGRVLQVEEITAARVGAGRAADREK